MRNPVQNTMAGILDIPHFKAWDMSNLTLVNLVKAANMFKGAAEECPTAGKDAVDFYTLNHLAAIIGKHRTINQPLSEDEIYVLSEWRNCLVTQTQRVMYYLAFICSREIRHSWEHGGAPSKSYICSKISGVSYDLQSTMRGGGYETALNAIRHAPNDFTAAQWFKDVELMFTAGGFQGSFGGKPWANITKALNMTLNGEHSPLMMVDTSFTLAHNNGPMHNKGMFYSSFGLASLRTLLDIQRAGQMPELVTERPQAFTFAISQRIRELVALMKKMYPDDINTNIDWDRVKDLGAQTDISHFLTKKKVVPKKKVPKIPVDGKLDTGEIFHIDQNFYLPVLKRVA